MSQNLIINRKLYLLALADCRGSELYKLVDYIATLNDTTLLNVIDDFAPWLYEYAVYIYATSITKELCNFIANNYNTKFDDQKTNFDHAVQSYIIWQSLLDEYCEKSLSDLLVKIYGYNKGLLKSILHTNFDNSNLQYSSIYLEFILNTEQDIGNYIHNDNLYFTKFENDRSNLKEFIVFLRNFHNLINYKIYNRPISFYDYVDYIGNKAVTGCIELITQISKSGRLESGDIIISKSVIDEFIRSREFQILKENKLLSMFSVNV